jgi:hypothetical protein
MSDSTIGRPSFQPVTIQESDYVAVVTQTTVTQLEQDTLSKVPTSIKANLYENNVENPSLTAPRKGLSNTPPPLEERQPPTEEETLFENAYVFANELAESNGLTPAEQGNLLFALLTNTPDPLLDQLKTLVFKEQGEEVFYGSPQVAQFKEQLLRQVSEKFEENLEKSGHSAAEKTALRALYYKEGADANPDVKALHDQALSQVLEERGVTLAFSTNEVFSKDFIRNEIVSSDAQFTAGLATAASKYKLSQKAQNLVQTLHYFPGLNMDHIPAGELASARNILSEISQGKENVEPAVDYYQAEIEGAILLKVSDLGLEAGGDVKNTQVLLLQAKKEVFALYGLPSDFVTSIDSKALETAFSTPSFLRSLEAVNSLKEFIAAGNSVALQLRDEDPAKSTLINFLKAISDAIIDLQKELSVMLIKDIEVTAKFTEMQKEVTLDKLAKRQQRFNEMEAVRKKGEKKSKKLAKISKLTSWTKKLGPLGSIFAVLMASAMGGPVGMALAITAEVQKGKGKDGIGDAFKKLTATVSKVFPGRAGEALAGMMKIAICMAAVHVVQFYAVDLFFNSSGAIQDIGKAAGLNEFQAEILNTVIYAVVQIAAAIILTVATAGVGGAAAIGQVGNAVVGVSAKVAGAVTKLEKIVSTIVKTLRSLMEAAKAAFNALNSNLQILLKALAKLLQVSVALGAGAIMAAPSIQTAIQEKTQEQLAILRGQSDAEQAEIADLIKLLKQIKNKMLGDLGALSDALADVGQNQNQFWKGQSETMTQLGNALQG